MKSSSFATLTFASSALALAIRDIPAGYQVITPGYSQYKCLTAANTNFALPSIQDCVPGAENQAWLIDSTGAVTTIQNTHKKCLDVPNGNQSNKQKLQMYTCTTANMNQQFVYNMTAKLIQVSGTSKCMDLTDGVKTNGVNPQIYTCDSTNPNQIWNLAAPSSNPVPVTPTPYPDGSPSPIIPVISNTTCFTAVGNYSGAGVVAQPCATGFTSAAQQFSFAGSVSAGGQFRIFGDKCLDVTNGVKNPGTKLQIYTCGTLQNKNQLFTVVTPNQFPKAHTVQWAGTGLCLDLTGGSYANGTPAQVWTCAKNFNVNQYFYLSKNEV